MKGRRGDSLLWAYYLATPLFAVLDFGFEMPIRTVGIESPGLRLVYYGGALLVGFVMTARPPLAPWLAMGESAANLTLLMASVLVPVWTLQETLDAEAIVDLPDRVVNLAVSGSVLVFRSTGTRRGQGCARRDPSNPLARYVCPIM